MATERFLARVLSVAASLGVLASGSVASAYCRTTTCDAEKEVCPLDQNGCLTAGLPLYWPDLCVSFGVHENGSPLRGISYSKAEEASRRAFQTWISADCGGYTPSIGVVSRGEIVCDQIEYNHDSDGDEDKEPSVAGPNANLIVFRDTEWPYPGDTKTIALTTITFAVSSGEILDADIEVNSRDVEISTGGTNVQNDLQSVMTHEVGHFFGLAHSRVPGASMNPNYDRGNLDFRSLSEDDRAGICEIYGPLATAASTGAGGEGSEETNGIDCRGEEPRYGFSRYCGENVLADGCAIQGVGKAPLLQDPRAALATPVKALRPEASNEAKARAVAEADARARDARKDLGPWLTIALPLMALGYAVLRRRRAS